MSAELTRAGWEETQHSRTSRREELTWRQWSTSSIDGQPASTAGRIHTHCTVAGAPERGYQAWWGLSLDIDFPMAVRGAATPDQAAEAIEEFRRITVDALRRALEEARSLATFLPGQRVRITGGEHTGRTGVVAKLPSETFRDHRRVELDPLPRERMKKTPLVAVHRLAPEDGA